MSAYLVILQMRCYANVICTVLWSVSAWLFVASWYCLRVVEGIKFIFGTKGHSWLILHFTGMEFGYLQKKATSIWNFETVNLEKVHHITQTGASVVYLIQPMTITILLH